jgi:DNA-binding Lrp family transcriptional regulator
MTGQPPPDALSIADLARRRGVSRQAIHRRVTALVTAGQLQTFAGPRRSVMVSEAAYDMAVGQHGDPAKELSVETAAATTPAAPTSSGDVTESSGYRTAREREAYYSAELKRLQLAREERELFRVTEVNDALLRIGEAIREAVSGLPARADEAAEVLETKGMASFRRWLAGVGDDISRRIAAELKVISAEADAAAHPAPASDGPTPADEENDDGP